MHRERAASQARIKRPGRADADANGAETEGLLRFAQIRGWLAREHIAQIEALKVDCQPAGEPLVGPLAVLLHG